MTVADYVDRILWRSMVMGMLGGILGLLLSGCLAVATGPLQTTGEALDRLDAQIVKACADLGDPVNTARIDALALLSSSTNEIADIRARRERYCEVFANG